MALCLVGVVIAAMADPESNSDTGGSPGGTVSHLLGGAVALAASWGYAAVAVLNRTLKEVHFSIILLYHGVLGTVIAVVYILMEHWITGNPYRVYTAAQYGQLACCCLAEFGLIACSIVSYQRAASGFVAVIAYSNVFWALAADVLVFHESIKALEVIGGGIILGVTGAVAVLKLRSGNTKKATEIADPR